MSEDQRLEGAYFEVVHPEPSASIYFRVVTGQIVGGIAEPIEFPQLTLRFNFRSRAQPKVWNQIRIPGIPASIINDQKIDPVYADGNYRTFALTHFVTNNVGAAEFPPAVVNRLGIWSTADEYYLWPYTVTQDQRRLRR